MRRLLLPLVLLFGFSSLATAGPHFDKVKLSLTRVSGSVYLLQGQGGNIAVSVGPDGLLMVDDQFLPLAQRIQGKLGALKSGTVRFVLNTHWHGDHTGGNPHFGKGAVIVAHRNVRKRLSKDQLIPFLKRTVKALPKVGLPVITFTRSLSVHFNAEEIAVRHVPHAHTDGDSVVFFRTSKVVHVGDLFFVGMFPFVDVDSGGSVQGLLVAVKALLKEIPGDYQIIPGHGPLTDLKAFRAYHEMLRATVAHVRKGMAAKKSLAQLQKAGLPARFKKWQGSFISEKAWISTIHRSYQRRPRH